LIFLKEKKKKKRKRKRKIKHFVLTKTTSFRYNYDAQSRFRIPHLKRQLQSIQHGSKSCTKYLQLIEQWADQLAAVAKQVEDDDLISFIISGLNPIFNSFITAFSFAVRDTDMSFVDFKSKFLSKNTLLENQQLPSDFRSFALYANKQINTPTFHSANRKPRYPPEIISRPFFFYKNETIHLTSLDLLEMVPLSLEIRPINPSTTTPTN